MSSSTLFCNLTSIYAADYDKVLSLLDEQSLEQFDKMAECVVKEYDQCCVNETANGEGPACVNGNNTQWENVVDNAGELDEFTA